MQDQDLKVFTSIREASKSVEDISPAEFIRQLRKAADRLEEVGVGVDQPATVFGIAAVCYSQAYNGVTKGWHE